jgi:hypothetical protein
MGSAIFTLLGVVLGGAIAQVGSWLGHRRQVAHESTRWKRDQMVGAYDNALRYLLRAHNRRSRLTAQGAQTLTEEHQREFFDDVVEAQFWLRTLHTRCGTIQLDRIGNAIDAVDTLYDGTFSHEGKLALNLTPLKTATDQVRECAAEEIGRRR